MKVETQGIMDTCCPECGTEFSEDDIMNLMFDPYNGHIVDCEECETEVSLEVKIEAMSLK